MSQKLKIIIIGAGFGGLELVKALHRLPVNILIVDRHNYHNFQPLMYQVATGGLEPGNIAFPVRRIFSSYKNVHFRMAEVNRVAVENKLLHTSIGPMQYDFLIIATGSTNNFYNFEPVKEKLLTLKSMPDALKLRNRIFQNLEQALAIHRKAPLDEIMNIAIVGGGPAGLELAGALAEMKKFVIPKEFPELDLSKMQINLYEAGPQLLAAMSDEASDKSLEYLRKLGVNVYLNTPVKSYDGTTMVVDDASSFKTDTVIWSAGVKASPIDGIPEDSISKGGRIRVDEFNRVIGLGNIFAIGDVAAHETDAHPKGLPMLAPVAQQQGVHLARNFKCILEGKPMHPFEYHNKGVMATIGRKKAVVDLPKVKFQGGFAWFVWMVVHIFSLAGFRNKAVTFIDWLTNYFSYDRPLGLILEPADTTSPAEISKKIENQKLQES